MSVEESQGCSAEGRGKHVISCCPVDICTGLGRTTATLPVAWKLQRGP